MELWHVYNRGVGGYPIVREETDQVRFVHDLFEMNDAQKTGNVGKYFKYTDLRNPYISKHDKARRERDLLVDIHGWCLMENHYHLLVSERLEGGLTTFLRKLNIGYANYFNDKYERSGAVYQGRTKKVLIENDAQFHYILHYIHSNPLDYLAGAEDWRHGIIHSARNALAHLDKYRWSSFLDYCNVPNFPSLLNTKLFHGIWPHYRKTLQSFLSDREQDDTSTTAVLWLEK